MSDERKHSRDLPNPLPYLWALLLDTVLVLVFALIGRASHDETTDLPGVLATAWPFLVGMLLASVLVFLLRWRPTRPAPAGVLVWVLTVLLGMGLRAISGQGTALAFVIVTTVTLLLFLVGWRLVPMVARRLSRRKAHPVGEPEDKDRAGREVFRDVRERDERFRDDERRDRD